MNPVPSSAKLAIVLAAMTGFSGHTQAASITLQQTTGYNTGAVTIRSDAPTGNINSNSQVIVGNVAATVLRGLFEFDLTQIETLAAGNPYTIDSVSFTLTTSTAGGTGGTTQFNLSLLGSNSDFDETTVTWNSAPSTAGGTIGTALSSATFNASTSGATRTFSSTAEFSTAVANALAGSDNTLRMILVTSNESGGTLARFNTNENTTESLRPSLTVNYTIVPEPGSVALIVAGAGLVSLRRRRN